jgi:hypothetical protein
MSAICRLAKPESEENEIAYTTNDGCYSFSTYSHMFEGIFELY